MGRGTEWEELFLVSMKLGHEICYLKRVLCCTEVVKVRVRTSLRKAKSQLCSQRIRTRKTPVISR